MLELALFKSLQFHSRAIWWILRWQRQLHVSSIWCAEKYHKSSNIRRPQKIVAPTFSWFLIISRGQSIKFMFDFKPDFKLSKQGPWCEVWKYFLTSAFFEVSLKIVSPKGLKLEKIVALFFEDLRNLMYSGRFWNFLKYLKYSKSVKTRLNMLFSLKAAQMLKC